MDKTPEKNAISSAKRYKGEGRVSFLANLESIRQEVEAGWPLQAIYDRHQDRLNIQYMQFHRYVSKYIKGETTSKRSETGMDKDNSKASLPKQYVLEASLPKKHLNDPTPLSDSELF